MCLSIKRQRTLVTYQYTLKYVVPMFDYCLPPLLDCMPCVSRDCLSVLTLPGTKEPSKCNICQINEFDFSSTYYILKFKISQRFILYLEEN